MVAPLEPLLWDPPGGREGPGFEQLAVLRPGRVPSGRAQGFATGVSQAGPSRGFRGLGDLGLRA